MKGLSIYYLPCLYSFLQLAQDAFCAGDSGAPLITFDDTTATGRYIALGVVSAKEDLNICSNTWPGIYIRLHDQSVLSFIKSTVFGIDIKPAGNFIPQHY